MQSWTYLTRRFIGMNYRDYIAMGIITTYCYGTVLQKQAENRDLQYTMQRVYTHDESDIRYRETTNRTDAAVKREHALAYSERVKKVRAEKEREAQLDAFNYLFGKNLKL
jgi:hypothetical protein